ncbi:MAG: phosphatase PAP2 family protein [Desulfovibrionaceae bacterium]
MRLTPLSQLVRTRLADAAPLPPLGPWLLASAPTLMLTAALWMGLGGETALAAACKLHRAAHPDFAAVLRVATDWIPPLLYLPMLALLWRVVRSGDAATRRFVLTFAVVQILVAALAVNLLKIAIGRARPSEDPGLSPFSLRGAYHSMPSGHTAETTGAVSALALWWGRGRAALALGLVLALLAFTRIYLGWHHPSDVLAGWLLGSCTGLLTLRLAPRPGRRSIP